MTTLIPVLIGPAKTNYRRTDDDFSWVPSDVIVYPYEDGLYVSMEAAFPKYTTSTRVEMRAVTRDELVQGLFQNPCRAYITCERMVDAMLVEAAARAGAVS